MDVTRAELAPSRIAANILAFVRSAPRVHRVAAAGIALAGMSAAPAHATDEPSTRLVRCGSQSCLQVSGYRADAASAVRINGRLVHVDGENGWKTRLPLETLRKWTAPQARTIRVSLHDASDRARSVEHVDLPIGLLGNSDNLGALQVRAPLATP